MLMLSLMMLICEVEYSCRQHVRHGTIHRCYLRWKHDDVRLLTETLPERLWLQRVANVGNVSPGCYSCKKNTQLPHVCKYKIKPTNGVNHINQF